MSRFGSTLEAEPKLATVEDMALVVGKLSLQLEDMRRLRDDWRRSAIVLVIALAFVTFWGGVR